MLQPYLDRMVSKLATDCMAQRAHKFFYKDWYAQNYSYCYDYIIQLSMDVMKECIDHNTFVKTMPE